MKKIIAFLLALALSCSMLTAVCSASSEREDIFIQISGAEGISKDHAHCKWIDGVDYKLNCAADGTVTGITFIHLVDPATTKIIEYYMNGVYFYEAKLNICQYFAGKQYTVLDVCMKHVFVSSTKVIVLDDGSVAETVTLTSDQITVTEMPLVIGQDGQPIYG